jgi:hypothetical protein
MRDPFVAEAGLNAGGYHRVKLLAARFVADAVSEIAIGADLLHRGKTATFVMYGGHAIADEHFRDVSDSSDLALERIGGSVRAADELALSDAVEDALRSVGDTAVEGARGVLVECAPGGFRVRRFTSAISNALEL